MIIFRRCRHKPSSFCVHLFKVYSFEKLRKFYEYQKTVLIVIQKRTDLNVDPEYRLHYTKLTKDA